MAYDNSNSGALFRNEDKREGKRDPDYRGSAEVDGVAYFVDSWINTSKDGTKKFSNHRSLVAPAYGAYPPITVKFHRQAADFPAPQFLKE